MSSDLDDTASVIGAAGAATFVSKDQVHDFTSSGTFTPTITGMYRITLIGAGGGGGGGGSAPTTGTLQVGGSGGAAGMYTEQTLPLVAGTTYTKAVGARSASRATGGAAGSNPGTSGAPGGTSTFSGPGIPTLYADGGAGGIFSAATSATPALVPVWGAGLSGEAVTATVAPGYGGQGTTIRAHGVAPTPYACGGQAGTPPRPGASAVPVGASARRGVAASPASPRTPGSQPVDRARTPPFPAAAVAAVVALTRALVAPGASAPTATFPSN